eukprot:c10731_g1_i1.p1 GENE.c10731_g1_i1~~c10731_g1_i1.p1  ORF type:complete len:256 (+),score=46.82 c10731_g1_i1:48-770(+)
MDEDEDTFDSMEEVMEVVLGQKDPSSTTKDSKWYKQSLAYWNGIEATVDGILGGFGFISEIDIKNSTKLVQSIFPNGQGARAVDCGAGIGRIANQLLQNHFQTIDLVEPDARYLQQAQSSITPSKFGIAFNCGLQDFQPKDVKYDCIWIQWVLNYLTDDDLKAVLARCRDALARSGVVVVKENTSSKGFILDRADMSVTRPDAHFRKIFRSSGFKVSQTFLEQGLPEGLFPVRNYVLKPS